MSQPPARLSGDLVPVRKGEATPATPLEKAQGASPSEPTSVAVSPPPSAPPRRTSAPPAPQFVREPSQQAARVSVSARLPPDLQEWIRVRAFVRRMPIQNLLEEIVEFYRQHHP
jgi:hypothetical protein